MGKLKEMVVEESSFTNRVKYNTRRLQLAGIGLFAKLDEERVRLYKQIVEASDQSDEGSVVNKLNALGTGTLNLVKEESQRIFDDLVETGEQVQSGGAKKPQAGEATGSKKKTAKPAQRVQKNEAAAEKPPKAKRASKSVTVDMELQQAFADAKARMEQAKDLPHEKSLALMALALQVEEGDVKGRRPAKAKVAECEMFDARREIKGMKQQEAMARFVAAVKDIA